MIVQANLSDVAARHYPHALNDGNRERLTLEQADAALAHLRKVVSEITPSDMVRILRDRVPPEGDTSKRERPSISLK